MPNKSKNRKPRGLTIKENDLEYYAVVLRRLGNGRVEIEDFEGNVTQAIIRGGLRRVRIEVNDIVLAQRREFQNDQSDILLKYTTDEVRVLRAQGEIPDKVQRKDEPPDVLDVVFDEINIDDI